MSVVKTEAEEIARAKILDGWRTDSEKPTILDDHAIERDWEQLVFPASAQI